MTMTKKVSVSPKGYYTAKEAAFRLELPVPTFYRRFNRGKIQAERWIPKGYTEGFYKKKDIDEIAEVEELARLLHSEDPITFHRVTTERDIRGIVDLCVAIYGQNGTPSYDARREIWEKNPDVYYIVKQADIVVGYISLICFDTIALDSLMKPAPPVKRSRISSAGTGIYSVTGPEHILPFIDNEQIDSLFISLGVRPGMSNTEQRDYALRLLRGGQEVLASFADRGMPIRMLYATSEKGDGMKMARKIGMKEIAFPGDIILRYELEVESSNSFLFRPYKEALSEWKSHQDRLSELADEALNDETEEGGFGR